MKLSSAALGYFIWVTIVYLCGVFIQLTFDFTKWTLVARVVVAIFGVVAGLLISMAAFSSSNKTDSNETL